MSKPICKIEIRTVTGKRANVNAVLDTGSFYTIVRESCLPQKAQVTHTKKEFFETARRGSKLEVTGSIVLKMKIATHWVRGEALVAPNLGAEMLIGAGLMQMWDISIRNLNGHTSIRVGRDMNDPEIQTVLLMRRAI